MINAILLTVDGNSEPITIDNGCKPLQDLVGEYIEAVSCADGQVTLWCNEEGKLFGLPINKLATALWWSLKPAMRGLDILCGPVVVTGGPDENGDTLSVPAFLRVGNA